MHIRGLKLKRSTPGSLMALALITAVAVEPIAHAQTSQTAAGSTIFENITLSPSFAPDPTTLRGISGGPKSATELVGRAETATGACNGFVDEQPDHTMILTEYFNFLSLQIQSTEDTTLVIRGPGGTWCNDDYTGQNPGIAGQWLSGTYQIWIGSYAQDTYSPYVIRITESQQQ